MSNDATPQAGLARLKQRLNEIPRLAVSFSGGIDSALLLKIAVDAMGPDRVIAITARGVNFLEREFEEAVAFARDLGVRHIFLDFDALSLREFVENSPERCYHCKKKLFRAAWDAARDAGADALADGANTDDDGDYRPGMRATRELGVLSPLRDAGFGKKEIRQLLRELSLAWWDKPSLACLASRIPYGTEIRAEDLRKIERAERFLLEFGFKNVRVRHHGNLARIEVNADERALLVDESTMERVDRELREIGYDYVTMDLRGYRTGSMNETL